MEKLMEPSQQYLTKEQFFARAKPAGHPVDIKDFGRVSIRAISAKEREAIKSGSTNTLTNVVDDSMFISLTLQKGLIEPKMDPADIAHLLESNFGIVNEISKRIWSLTRVGEDIKNA